MPRSVPFAILLLAGRLVRPKTDRTPSSQREGPSHARVHPDQHRPQRLLARRDEDGASAVEYGLLVAGIAALIVAIVFLFGGMISDVFSATCDQGRPAAAATGATCASLTKFTRPGGAVLHSSTGFRSSLPIRHGSSREAPHVACGSQMRAGRPSRPRTARRPSSTACWSPASPRLIVAVVFLFGGAVADLFDDTCDSVGTGSGGSMSCARLLDLRPQAPALPRAQGCRAAPQRARVSIAPAHRGVVSRLALRPVPTPQGEGAGRTSLPHSRRSARAGSALALLQRTGEADPLQRRRVRPEPELAPAGAGRRH